MENAGDQQEDEEEKEMQLDVDELNDNEKQMLVAYLQEEYEKNPDTFQFQKEKLAEIAQQIQQKGGQGLAEANVIGEDNELEGEDQEVAAGEQVIEDEDGQEIEEEGDLNIHGGEQQIEDDGFPTEQEMIDQNLSPEQIQQILMMKAQNQQQQEQMYGQEADDYEEEQDQMGQDQHQMKQIYGAKKKKKVKSQGNMDQRVQSGQIVSSSRYKQARNKKTEFK